MFPGFRLSLPPKRWFKDNYDSSFLEDRQLGLQAFLQNLVAHKDISNWYVHEPPPGSFESRWFDTLPHSGVPRRTERQMSSLSLASSTISRDIR